MKTLIKNTLVLIFLFVGLAVFAQEKKKIITIYGTVLSQDSVKYISNTHVINKTTYTGTITNGIGEFLIQGEVGDTLVFSNVSYQFYYHTITGTEPENLIIQLKTRNYLLDEVSVTAYKLTSNDPKPMVIGKPMIPRNEDLVSPRALPPTLANPIDFLYAAFSRRSKEIEKLRQLYAEDYYKRKLKEGNNRETLVALTGLDRQELEVFMFYCKYAETYISTLNDYEFLISLLNCYDQYQRERTVNQLLEEQEVQQKIEGERFRE